jgi:ABC-type lipoprotein release transport system permease subunit
VTSALRRWRERRRGRLPALMARLLLIVLAGAGTLIFAAAIISGFIPT